MDFTQSHTYDASVDGVVGMLGDRNANIAKYQSMNHRDVKILECEAGDRTLRIVSSRVVDVELPSFAKRVLKPTNTMLQTDQWTRRDDGSWEGTFDVEVHGAPVHISGTMSLSPSDGQSVHEVTVHVDVKVPVIGGRIAAWAANGEVRRGVDQEFSFNDKWLKDYPCAADH